MGPSYNIGVCTIPLSPNFTNIQVLPSAPNSISTGRMYFDIGLGEIGVYYGGWNYIGGGGGGGSVASVFGRTGVVTAHSTDYTGIYFPVPTGSTAQYIRGDGSLATLPTTIAWANITGTPTTLAGYNISNGQTTITLTTTGTSGAATLIGATLNIPQYAAGTGTVTTFSSGALSPLFTTSVATATSTPALTFALSTAVANSILGNNTGSTAAPTYFVPTASTINAWFGGTLQGVLSLTTTGTSGAATLISNVLNIPQYASAITTVQYMWVVGGANNFSTLPGTPTAPVAAATTLVDSSLSGLAVRVFRGSFPLMGINPGDGTQYYTKVKASNTLTFSSALVNGEQIIVETIPQ